ARGNQSAIRTDGQAGHGIVLAPKLCHLLAVGYIVDNCMGAIYLGNGDQSLAILAQDPRIPDVGNGPLAPQWLWQPWLRSWVGLGFGSPDRTEQPQDEGQGQATADSRCGPERGNARALDWPLK